MPEAGAVSRSRRLWLLQRIGAARRSLELLDEKRQVLRQEMEHLDRRAGRAEADWEVACSTARLWALRSRAVVATTDLALAEAASRPARCDISWVQTVGVRYPAKAEIVGSELGGTTAAAVSDSVRRSAGAHLLAAAAAAECAAARAACATVRAELQRTDRRHRALQRQRIPALEDELHRCELRLDELEREEQVRVRRSLNTAAAPGWVQRP